MMPIRRAAMTFFLLLPASFAWTQEAPERDSPQASSPPSEDDTADDGAPSGTLRVLNPDGSPAAGAKVLVGDANRLRTIFDGQVLPLPEMGGGMGGPMMGGGMDEMMMDEQMMGMEGGRSRREPREVTWRQTDQKGQIELSGRDFQVMGGGMMDMGVGMGGYGRETLKLPPLLIRDDQHHFAFLPPGSDRGTVQLREAAQLQVKLPVSTGGPPPDLRALAWWNNGFALPRDPNELGYKQQDLMRGWKFHSYFAVFRTVPIRLSHDPFRGEMGQPFGGAPAHAVASLSVPPGEVRVTLLPTSELEPSIDASDRPGAGADDSGSTATAPDYSRLVELALYGGPSQIVSAESGEQKVVGFEDSTHSVEVKTQDPQQTLPQWDNSDDEDTAVFLIRDVALPGENGTENDRSVIQAGSRAFETLLARSRSLRSQLPPVRIGRRTSGGTYRFDLLAPGTYHVRVGKRSDLQGPTPPSRLGERVHVRQIGRSPVETYAISFEPDGGGWGDALVIDEDPPRDRSGEPVDDPFGRSASKPPRGEEPFGGRPDDDPFGGSEDDPFGGSSDDDPFGGSSDDDPFGRPDREGGQAAEADRGDDPFGGAEPDEPAADRQQRRLRMLKARIRRLQQQLEAAARLVEQLEADAGSPSR